MKICDLTQSYNASSGGIRTYIHEKQKHLKEHTNWKHVLIIPGDKDRCYQNGQLKTYEIEAPTIVGCEPYRFILRLSKVIAILTKEQPDIIELGSAYILPWAAFYYRKKYPCSVIGFYHTNYPSAYVQTSVSTLLGKNWGEKAKTVSEKYVRLIYNKFDSTLTPSKMLQKHLFSIGIQRVTHIPLGVDLHLFNPRKRDQNFRRKFKLSGKDILLVYAGRFDSEKRVNIIVEAFKKLPKDLDIHLLMIGEGPLKGFLQTEAKNHGNIFVLPYELNKDRFARLLASADIYITAGPYETFGLSILEAQASGLPVIGVRAGALKERVDHSTGILGLPDSVDDLASNIQTLANNGYRKKGKNARELVEYFYSWDSTFHQLFDLYETFQLQTQLKYQKQTSKIIEFRELKTNLRKIKNKLQTSHLTS